MNKLNGRERRKKRKNKLISLFPKKYKIFYSEKKKYRWN